jgi:hypothetical protein
VIDVNGWLRRHAAPTLLVIVMLSPMFVATALLIGVAAAATTLGALAAGGLSVTVLVTGHVRARTREALDEFARSRTREDRVLALELLSDLPAGEQERLLVRGLPVEFRDQVRTILHRRDERGYRDRLEDAVDLYAETRVR